MRLQSLRAVAAHAVKRRGVSAANEPAATMHNLPSNRGDCSIVFEPWIRRRNTT